MGCFFFHPSLGENEVVTLPPEEGHHLEVERIGAGEEIFLGNGKGQLFRGVYLGKREGKHWVEVRERVQEENPPFSIWVWQAFLHAPSRLDWLVEKLTEIGVSRIVFFPAHRSLVLGASFQRMGRWQKIVRSACKQSGRLTFPEVEVIESWNTFLTRLEKSSGTVLLTDFAASQTLFQVVGAFRETAWNLVIGPEGDFTEEEKRVISALSQARGVKLLSKVLRSETAAVFGASILVSLLDGTHADCH
ncbi:MAG: RsmE family RNA methyltransferase [Atribacterota bacterium]